MFCSAKKSSKTEFYIDWMLHFGEGIHSSYVYFTEKILFKNKEHTLYFVYLFINERTLLWTVLVKLVVVFFFCRHTFKVGICFPNDLQISTYFVYILGNECLSSKSFGIYVPIKNVASIGIDNIIQAKKIDFFFVQKL